jgi:hypothetical protein
MRDSDQMRVNVGCIHHGRNDIFYSSSAQKAEVHLKLVLENIQKSGSGVKTVQSTWQATDLQNLEGVIDSIDAISRERIQERSTYPH